MPQKTWVIGEEVLAPDFNTYVQNQVIPRFATVAARDAAWPAATAGNGAYCDTADTGTMWRSNGTVWLPALDAAFGFYVRKAVDEPARGTGQSFQITYDTCVQNVGFLGSAVPGPIAPAVNFAVPTGAGGVYALDAGAYWAQGALAGIALSISVNGVAVGAQNAQPGASQSFYISRVARLAAADVVNVTAYNNSGGNLIISTYAGNILSPPVPYFSMWRLSA